MKKQIRIRRTIGNEVRYVVDELNEPLRMYKNRNELLINEFSNKEVDIMFNKETVDFVLEISIEINPKIKDYK